MQTVYSRPSRFDRLSGVLQHPPMDAMDERVGEELSVPFGRRLELVP